MGDANYPVVSTRRFAHLRCPLLSMAPTLGGADGGGKSVIRSDNLELRDHAFLERPNAEAYLTNRKARAGRWVVYVDQRISHRRPALYLYRLLFAI